MTARYPDSFTNEIARFKIGNRTDSVALLAWFLSNVWRIEPEEVDDAICDGGGDRGIDAIVVDEDAHEITVFQSKQTLLAQRRQGDKDIRAFSGVSAYFRDLRSLRSLRDNKPQPQ